MRIAKSVAELIGRTPMLELTHFEQTHCLNAHLLAKVESFNPGGSVKDRIALGMVEAAEKAGKLLPGGTIIEPTSGNTGIGLAMVAAARGYTAIIVMPDSMSVERRQLMLAYGAKLVLTPGKLGMKGAVDKANELAAETPNAIVVGQFVNPANPATHRATTGPEIWADTDGQVDVLVAGIGTGGTLTGIGSYLREKNPNVRIVAVEPFSSPLLSKGVAGPHGLMGIGANFVPDVLNRDLIDEIITVKEDDAYRTGRELAAHEGVLAGITSGAAVWAASQVGRVRNSRARTSSSSCPTQASGICPRRCSPSTSESPAFPKNCFREGSFFASSRNLVGKSSLGARLRTRKVTGRDASLPAPLLIAFEMLGARGTIGALPQTPQGTLSLDPFSRVSWSRFHAPSACSFFGASPYYITQFPAQSPSSA